MNLQWKTVLFVLFFHPTTPEKWLRTVFLNAQYDGGSVITSIAQQEVGPGFKPVEDPSAHVLFVLPLELQELLLKRRLSNSVWMGTFANKSSI